MQSEFLQKSWVAIQVSIGVQRPQPDLRPQKKLDRLTTTCIKTLLIFRDVEHAERSSRTTDDSIVERDVCLANEIPAIVIRITKVVKTGLERGKESSQVDLRPEGGQREEGEEC